MKYFNIIELKNFIGSSSFFLAINEDNNINFLTITDIPELVSMVDVLSMSYDTFNLTDSECLKNYKYLKIYSKEIKSKEQLLTLLNPNSRFNIISFSSKSLEVGYSNINFSEIILDINSESNLNDWKNNFKNDNLEPVVYIERITFDIQNIINKGE